MTKNGNEEYLALGLILLVLKLLPTLSVREVHRG